MSNLPSTRPCIWKTELGVGVTFTFNPSSAKKPFASATQIGQLKPPGKTMTSRGCPAWLQTEARVTMTARKLRAVFMSVRLDAGRLHHLPDARGFRLHERIEFRRLHRHGLGPEVRQLLLDLGRGERLYRFGIQ